MPVETTKLTPPEEAVFRVWAAQNGITDVDHPDSHYDYRGFWKSTQGAPHPSGVEQHFPDTFKQHGHPTFSIESQYSKGPWDGGMWSGDNYVPEMKPAPSHAPAKLDAEDKQAILHLGSAELTPLEEILYRAWANANGIDKPEDPNLKTDYRSLYKDTGGQVFPIGTLKQSADNAYAMTRLNRLDQGHAATNLETELLKSERTHD